MAMRDWIHQYPRVQALLQGEDEELVGASTEDAEETPISLSEITTPLIRHHYYRLEGTTAVEETDLHRFEDWLATADRHVALTNFAGGVQVSTVFLGINHQWFNGPPILFETMIFWDGHVLNEAQERYSTWEEAVQGHEAMCAQVRAALAERTP